MNNARTIFVIDDDEELRASIGALAASLGFPCRGFSSAEAFLAAYSPEERGVAVIDLRMPGMNGLQLQEELTRRRSRMPVILLTAFARTPTIVKALQAGAVTAIDKPYHDDDLWDALRSALDKEETEWTATRRRQEIRNRIASLTSEERQVSELVVAGRANKTIAHETGLALRTVEKRRHNAFLKLQIDSVAEMVALFLESREGT